ncbi:MAG: hypothetical protein WAM92_16860 [Mycobacterium sp.]
MSASHDATIASNTVHTVATLIERSASRVGAAVPLNDFRNALVRT